MKRKRMPLGIARLVGGVRAGQGRAVALYDLGRLYAVLGLTDDTFVDWMWKYGADSLGMSPDGRILIPDFPIFSKVAWMNIDPVRISGPEIVELVSECERALGTAPPSQECQDFLDLKALGEEAIAVSGEVEFGHP